MTFILSNWVRPTIVVVMERILIIGHPGSGKSTLALALSKILDLPLIHLDREFWQPGWIETPKDLWREKVKNMVNREKWILDGTYDRALDIRLPQADTVIFLDYSRYTCIWRILKRVAFNYGRVRLDMADGCPERIDLTFLKWVWNYRRDRYPIICDLLQSHFTHGNLVVLKNLSDAKKFLIEVGAAMNLSPI